MSTGIYNAYMCSGTWSTLNGIGEELGRIAADARPVIDAYTKTLITRETENVMHTLLLGRLKPDKLDARRTMLDTAVSIIEKVQYTSRDENQHCDAEFSLSSVLFKCDDRGSTSVIFFGHELWLNFIRDNAESYGLSDYHYQNSTDKPNDVSDLEWDEREAHWDTVMPSGTPSKDGFARSVYCPGYDHFHKALQTYTEDDWAVNTQPYDVRVEKLAEMRAKDLYGRTAGVAGLLKLVGRDVDSEDIDLQDVETVRYRHILHKSRRVLDNALSATSDYTYQNIQETCSSWMVNGAGPDEMKDWVGTRVFVESKSAGVDIHGIVTRTHTDEFGDWLTIRTDRWKEARRFRFRADNITWIGV